MSGQPWYSGAPRVDSWLNAIATFGVPTSLWLAFDAVLFAMHFEYFGKFLGLLSVVMLLGSSILPWSKVGWHLFEAAWLLLSGVMVVSLFGAGHIMWLCLIPIVVLSLLFRLRPIVFARYEGRDPGVIGLKPQPPDGPCQVCGNSDSDFVAPRICISAGIYTYSYHGTVRNLCRLHARLYAIPAALISLLLGTPGIPFGLVLGPTSALKNIMDGGDAVSSRGANEMRTASQLDGDAHGFLQAGALMAGLFYVGGATSVLVLRHVDRVLLGG